MDGKLSSKASKSKHNHKESKKSKGEKLKRFLQPSHHGIAKCLIPRQKLRMGELIGQGTFGGVHLGWVDPSEEIGNFAFFHSSAASATVSATSSLTASSVVGGGGGGGGGG